ncbi:T9SS type A sorting domain-containing protein [bacterium]|nr:T9SS type A sorting domain-containing protein [bacterium]
MHKPSSHSTRHVLIALTIILAFLPFVAFTQPELQWTRTYGGVRSDECYSMIQTTDGGYAIAGRTESFNTENLGFWFIKTDADGDSLWSLIIDGENRDECHSIIQTADEGYALAGFTMSFGSGHSDMWLVKIDSVGEIIWSQTYGGEGGERCFSIIQTSDGGYALAGETHSFGAGEWDMWLVKTNSDGDSLWSRTFGGRDEDRCYSIVQTGDGGFALAGLTKSFRAQGTDMWLVKTDNNGDSLWAYKYGYRNDEECYSMIQCSDGGFALAGKYDPGGVSWDRDMLLLKTDEEGDSLWSRRFGGSGNEYCQSIKQTPDGGYALGGWTTSFGMNGTSDMWLVRTDTNGDSLWSLTEGRNTADNCYSIVQTEDGGYAMAGNILNDMSLVKTESDPVSVPNRERPISVEHFILLPAYPNPFNNSCKLSYELPFNNQVSIVLHDGAGRYLKEVVNQNQGAGYHNCLIEASDLPAGVYFVRFSTNQFEQNQKLLLIR